MDTSSFNMTTTGFMSSTDNDQVYKNLMESMSLNKTKRENYTAKRLALLKEQAEIENMMDRYKVVARLKDPTINDLQFLQQFKDTNVR